MQNTENTGLQEYKYIENYKDIKAVMEENLGGEKLSLGSLDRIKIPAGGATNWEVLTLDGAQSVPAITGVVVHEQKTRTFWHDSFEETGGGEQPDCYSEDLLTGVGDPGGDCETCPFGSFSADGARPECREGRTLFVLTKDAALPVAVQLPPSSLRAFRDYKLRLSQNLILLSETETIISLEKTASKKGINYSRAVFRVGARATDKQKKLLSEQSQAIRELVSSSRHALPAPAAQGALPESENAARPLESETGI